MLKVEDNPIAQAIIVAVLYVMSVAALMFSNELIMGPSDAPWVWMGAFWAGLFAPTLVTMLLAAVFVGPPWQTLKRLYGVALIATLGLIELLSLKQVSLATAVIAEVGLMIAVLLTFRRYG